MMASLLDVLNNAAKKKLTKEEFGHIMHDEDSTEEEKMEALKDLENLGGYDCLPDE
jgi:hypothetical protein